MNLLSLTFAVSIRVPIIALAEESAGSTTAAMLLNVNVPNTGREKLVIFPTAQMTVGHQRGDFATSMILKHVFALQAGKVSLNIVKNLLLRGCMWFLEVFETVLDKCLCFNWEENQASIQLLLLTDCWEEVLVSSCATMQSCQLDV